MNEERMKEERQSGGWREQLKFVLSAALMLFGAYTSATVPLEPTLQRGIFLLIIVLIAILAHPASRNFRTLDMVLAIAAILSIGYLIVNWEELAYRAQFEPAWHEILFGFLALAVVLELTRRTIGATLSVLAIVTILYAYFGNWIPAPFSHRGYSIARLMANQYLTHEGLFSSVLGVAATLVPAFILFGCALQVAGVADLLMSVASRLSLGPGGPAKLAVTASAFFGTISGSSTANVVGTGTTTIPLMKRAGFEPSFAGAVEAVASTGGQIMPPVMGVAAFLMSEVTGIPYATIALAAVVPAILYYAAVYIEVDLEARRLSLTAALKAEVGGGRPVWQQLYMLLPFVVLIYLLLSVYSPMKSAFWATVGVVALSFVRAETRLTWEKVRSLIVMFTQGTVTVAVACATAGIVVGALNITGAGLKMTYALVEMAGKERVLLAIIVMIICIILGMGLPTPAAYAVAASFAAPMLALVGMNKFQAHMFILYFASLSSITPPVAIAAYAAAGIANAPPMRTGWIAWKLGLAAFIVPFMFTESMALFIGQAGALDTIQASLTGLLGVACLAMATIGFLFGPIGLWERAGYFLASLLLLYPTFLVSLLGIAIGGALLAFHHWKYRLRRQGGEESVRT